MPWLRVPMKDVGNCDKPRRVVNKRWLGDFRMGEPTWIHIHVFIPEHIGYVKDTQGTETSQYLWTRNQTRFP